MMDANSLGAGYMAVFAVSGSVVLVALQVHKRLLSDFMKKMEFEMGCSGKNQPKKKVRFADDAVTKLSSENNKAQMMMMTKKQCYQRRVPTEEKLEAMPLNWQALYRGIIQHRALRCLD